MGKEEVPGLGMKDVDEMNILMQCGHTANAKDENNNPVCAICIGYKEGATKIEDKIPNLIGRKSRCPSCLKEKESNLELPFFEHKPNTEFDSHYDGCRGWG